MTKEEKARYRPPEELREALIWLKSQKFELDCGHHVTFGSCFLGNDIIIRNGKSPEVVCLECGR